MPSEERRDNSIHGLDLFQMALTGSFSTVKTAMCPTRHGRLPNRFVKPKGTKGQCLQAHLAQSDQIQLTFRREQHEIPPKKLPCKAMGAPSAFLSTVFAARSTCRSAFFPKSVMVATMSLQSASRARRLSCARRQKNKLQRSGTAWKILRGTIRIL